jgi:molybdopterin-guanine dinucleotide biosynthesis protein A
MQQDKALLGWEDTTLLDHTLARLSAVTSDVALLPGATLRYADRGVRLILDAHGDAGPLGAVASALQSTARPRGLFLGVDLPFVSVALLEYLIQRSEGWDVTVPAWDRGHEPLCAVYTRECLAPILDRIENEALEMTSFWRHVRVQEIGLPELRAFGDPSELFRNLNTRPDYDSARLR